MSQHNNVLIVGATRGLGSALVKHYVSLKSKVYATSRSDQTEDKLDDSVTWVTGIDVGTQSAGPRLAEALEKVKIDLVILTAGFFAKESFDEPSFEDQVTMYRTSAVGPVFIAHHLVTSGVLVDGGKFVIISSESGSIALRHESEGGGNYGHHASKTASNMVAKLLSLDLKDKGITVLSLHPGFMRTKMTKDVGFDQFWDSGNAVTPEEAAKSLIDFISASDISRTGQYWAPRGPADIGTAENVLGPKDSLPTPLQLPW